VVTNFLAPFVPEEATAKHHPERWDEQPIPHDCSVDPLENANLTTREPADAMRMAAMLDSYLRSAGRNAVEKQVWIALKIAERLLAMGYLR
jgi:hypothetical protein